ncbi:MAG: circadian clock protein KaiB [Planctomycetes bacterium]|nr:circadian clock protein KaiB [Planctomycetota bacterium]
MYHFRLYVVGQHPRSVEASAQIRRLLDKRLKNNYALEVVDLLKRPQMGRDDRILATPTLIKLSPPPVRRVVGDFRNTENLPHLLGLTSEDGNSGKTQQHTSW